MVAVAIGGAAVLGAVTTSVASSNAAHVQESAAAQASKTQQGFFDTANSALQPYYQGGQGAYSTLNNLLGVGGTGNPTQMQDTLNNLPGYQFTLNQGLKSTQNGYAARGLSDSGGALKGAATYATGLANSQYGNYVNQLQNSATTGANAAGALAQTSTQTGSNIGNNIIGAGNAAAAASNATGASVNSGLNNISSYYTLNSLLQNNGIGGSGNSTIYQNAPPSGPQ